MKAPYESSQIPLGQWYSLDRISRLVGNPDKREVYKKYGAFITECKGLKLKGANFIKDDVIAYAEYRAQNVIEYKGIKLNQSGWACMLDLTRERVRQLIVKGQLIERLDERFPDENELKQLFTQRIVYKRYEESEHKTS